MFTITISLSHCFQQEHCIYGRVSKSRRRGISCIQKYTLRSLIDFVMSSSPNAPSSRFSDYSSIYSSDAPSSPSSPSPKIVTKKFSNLLSPTNRKSPALLADVPYSANTSPPLHKSFSNSSSSLRSSLGRSKKNVFSAVKESWQAGLSTKQEQGRFSDTEPSSPRHAPLSDLQQAHRRRLARDIATSAPNRVDYILYLNGMGPPVEHCTILENMWEDPEAEALYADHVLWVDEGTPNAAPFF